MIWDYFKGGSSRGQKEEEEDETWRVFSFFLRIIGRVGGICGRKPQYNTKFKCCFWIFFNKTWDYIVIWIHVHLLFKFYVVLDYDEMTYNLVSRVFFIMYSKM
jgi:hypothetical protein